MSAAPREFMVALFRDERLLVDAVRAIRARGLRVYDVYSPFPVHGLDEAMAIRQSRLSVATLAGGCLGLIAAMALQFYTAVVDWPLNVGGKPDNSTLAFIPIAFELTILGAGLATVAALLARCRLWPAVAIRSADMAATDDLFVITLRCRQTAFDRGLAERLLFEHGAESVVWKTLAL
jgi:ActD protein